MKNTNDLAAALAARNAKTLAWVAEDPSNRWAMTMVEDLAHWENTNDLAAALAARNAKTLAWVAEDPSNRWAMTMVEDLAHWAEVGVTTAAELDHYLLACDAYESTREAWGYKPDWSGLMNCSNEQLERIVDSNIRAMREQREEEEREEQRERDEQRAHEQAFSAAMTPSGAWSIGDLVSL